MKVRRDAQSRENWQMRALKLQLLHPGTFHDVQRLLFGSAPQRNYTAGYFTSLAEHGILAKIRFGQNTAYRQALMVKACKELTRGRKHKAKAIPQAQIPE